MCLLAHLARSTLTKCIQRFDPSRQTDDFILKVPPSFTFVRKLTHQRRMMKGLGLELGWGVIEKIVAVIDLNLNGHCFAMLGWGNSRT